MDSCTWLSLNLTHNLLKKHTQKTLENLIVKRGVYTHTCL